MSDVLESGYRKVLRLLPRTYRAQHTEEMVAVLMDGAEPGQTRPKPVEVLSVAILALRLRLTGRTAANSVALAGDVARRAVLTLLIFDFALLVQWTAYGARIGYAFLPVLLHAGVIAAFVLGWSWCGQALCVAYGGYLIHSLQWRYWNFSSTSSYGGLIIEAPLLVLALAFMVFHRRAPRIAGTKRWFLALAVITLAFWIRGKTVDHMREFDISHTPVLPTLLYVGAAIFALRQARTSPVWPLALASAGLPVAAGTTLACVRNNLDAHALADSSRDAIYVAVVMGSEVLLVGAALTALVLAYQRRASSPNSVA